MASVFADEGTAAHWVLEQCLILLYDHRFDESLVKADNWVGQHINIPEDNPGDHALLSPSGAKGWMQCGQRAKMSAKYPEPYQPGREVVFTQDYADAVQVCLDYVATRVQWITEHYGPVTVRAERKVSSKRFTGSDKTDGTSDVTLVADGYCEHIDFKGGRGVAVPAEDPQNGWYFLGTLAEYATGVADEMTGLAVSWSLPFQKARLTICQPRCDKIEPRTRWVDIEDVTEWFTKFLYEGKRAIANAEDPDAPFSPSDAACRWCAAGGDAKNTGAEVCEAYVAHSLEQAGIPPDGSGFGETSEEVFAAGLTFSQQDPDVLSDSQYVGLLDIREMVTGMLSTVEACALKKLETGDAGPLLKERYKLVRGKSQRKYAQGPDDTVRRLKKIKFIDPDGAVDKEGAPKVRTFKKGELFEEKLKTLVQIEAMLKKFRPEKIMWEAFNAAIEKPPGKITIAPMDDPRDPVDPLVTAEQAFGDLPDQPTATA